MIERIQSLLDDSLVHIVEDVQPNPDVSYLKDVYEAFWQQAQKKYSLYLEQTWPTVAIIHPELMLTVPEKVAVSTGLDALSHALESIWNVNANLISDTFSISAIQDIFTYLPLLQKDQGNI
ncbi:hypothetical protein [Alcaligenes faecalis]|uniref:hypothetical protein n=1 Tax=Alcaligenes faecalis TaxID=511 RepID=UPI003B96EAD7